MKKLLTTFALVAALSAPAAAVSVGAGAGYVLGMPMGDFADGSKMSIIGFGGKVLIGVIPQLNIEVGANYHVKFPVNWDEVPGGEPTNGDDYYTTLILPKFGVGYDLPVGPVVISPHAGGCYGMFSSKVPEGVTEPDSVNKLGFYGGLALKYPVTPEMNIAFGFDFDYILEVVEDVEGTPADESMDAMLIEIPVGIEYWFM
jgi:hypothetical protein